jgi:hypothetical protein
MPDRQTDSDLRTHDELSITEYCEKFSPEQYLKEYYSSDQMWVTDMIIARESWDWLNSLGRRFTSALDVGTGPVLEYPFLFAPFVDRYDLADYVENNLFAIRRWLDRSPNAHDWNPIFRGVLRSLGQSLDQLEARTQLLRDSIHTLRSIDLRQTEPLGSKAQYDLVTTFFCTECVDTSIEGWSQCNRSRLGLID